MRPCSGKKALLDTVRLVLTGLLASLLCSCEDGGGGGGGGGDVGSNDPNVYVALGDSITGGNGVSQPYPSILSGMLGKTVYNQGQGGATSGDGVGRVKGLLARYKPGHLLILYGANDLAFGHDIGFTVANLRTIIQAAKANQTIPVIGTLTPMMYAHATFAGGATALSAEIRAMASEEGAAVANLESAFGNNPDYMQADGEHPNQQGAQVMAETFAGAL
jgi:lysophospholipase L1-like esterase